MKKGAADVGSRSMCEMPLPDGGYTPVRKFSPESAGHECKVGGATPDLLQARVSNHFTLFALESSFAVDTTALQRSYIKLQQQYHPDRFMGKTEQERTSALQQSMTVNEAYNTLKDPFKRGEYLLSLQGIRIKEGQGSVKPSQETLMAMMEWRERLEEATTPEAIQSIATEVEDEKTAVLSALSGYFAAGDYDQAAQGVIRLRYLDKTVEELTLRRR